MGARYVLIGRAIALAALGASAALAAGCLQELDEARVCPPKPKHAASDCLTGLQTAEPGRCLKPDQMKCLTGRTSCSCTSDACPTQPDACFPTGDCPPDVKEIAGDRAECFHLKPSEIGGGQDEASLCVCGCAGCAAQCDGVGPVLGVSDDGQPMEYLPLVIDISRITPKKGTLGIYTRVRGFASYAILVGLDDPDNPWPSDAAYFELIPVQGDFSSQVAYDQKLLAQGPYSWKDDAHRPRRLAILPSIGSSSAPAVTILEIDCIIPFIVPAD